MLKPDQIKVLLQDRILMKVAKSAGVKYHILYGWYALGNPPSYDLIAKLSDYFESQEATYQEAR